MTNIEHRFDIFTREVSRRGFLRASALSLTLLLLRQQTPSIVRAERQIPEAVFDIKLEPNQTYVTPDSYFLTVKGDVFVDGVDVKNSDDPSLGTLGRTYKTRVELRAPYGANIHGNLDRCESDTYYLDSDREIREKGCLNGCGDIKEWFRGDPNTDVCEPATAVSVPTAAPTLVVIPPSPTVTTPRATAVCVTESPFKPGQELPSQPFDYEVCAGVTVFVPRQSVIQGDVEPVENGTPRETWHDGETNSGLITITGRDGLWRFNWGGDVYFDPDPTRLLKYAQEMAVLMKSRGCGTGVGCLDGVSILRWPEDKGQGE